MLPLADAARAAFPVRELSEAEAGPSDSASGSVRGAVRPPGGGVPPDGALVAMLDERGTLAEAHVVFAPSGS